MHHFRAILGDFNEDKIISRIFRSNTLRLTGLWKPLEIFKKRNKKTNLVLKSPNTKLLSVMVSLDALPFQVQRSRFSKK